MKKVFYRAVIAPVSNNPVGIWFGDNDPGFKKGDTDITIPFSGANIEGVFECRDIVKDPNGNESIITYELMPVE